MCGSQTYVASKKNLKLTGQISLAEVKNKLKKQRHILDGPLKDYLAIN